MNKLVIAIFVATTMTAALADVYVSRGGGCGYWNNNMYRVSYQHVPLTDPSEPYHDTYRKNLGEVDHKVAKPVANLHAKQSAAQADALRQAAKATQTQRPTISVYSNVTARQPAQPANNASGGEHNITINNSNVVINN